MSDLLDGRPRHPAGGAADARAFGEAVFEWLAGFDLPGAVPTPISGPCTVVALESQGVTGIWAVPDAAISADLRAALDAPWAPTFAEEEVVMPGQLWLLALCGEGDRALYDWQGPALGVDVAALVAAHRGWDAHFTTAAALKGALVTHCYAAHYVR